MTRPNKEFYDKYFDCQKLDKGTCMWTTKWYGITAAARVMCPDGKVRMARTHQSPCMFGAIDARVTMANKQTVQGTITVTETFNCKYFMFHPHAWKIVWHKTPQTRNLFNDTPGAGPVTEWFASEKAMHFRVNQLWCSKMAMVCRISNPSEQTLDSWGW